MSLLEPLDFAARDTPLQPADRLGAALGLDRGRLWVKRDDLTGLAGGGNKARKLEWLVAEAVGAGADVLVTTGAAQSNHVRSTAAAARSAGLDCVAILTERHPKTVADGNLVLDDLLGLRVVWSTYSKLSATIADTLSRLRSEGRTPYDIPLGGSSAIGSSAYALCADEILAVVPDAAVVCADESGGTHAGLAAGVGDHGRVIGYDVGGLAELERTVAELAGASARLLGRPPPVGEPRIDHEQAQVPYGEPTDETFAAMRLVAATEGLILDPVYSGRAMAGLVSWARSDRLPDQSIVFVHTGGMPAVFTQRYADRFGIHPY